MLTMAAFGSGGGGDAGGGGGAAAVPVVPGQVLLHDSFGWGPNSTGMRPTGGTGTFQWMGQHDLSSDWAEIPANNTEIWSAPGGRQARTWQFSSSSLNPKQPPSPWESWPQSNGTVTVIGGTPGVYDNPTAVLPFTGPSIAYETSVDIVIEPNQIGDWIGVGFSASNAVNHNLESAGQVWMLFKMDNPQFDSYSGTVELHTNGMSGQSVSMKVTRMNFDTMTVKYDPVLKLVSGYFNGLLIGTVPYTANGVKCVAIEGASAANDYMTVDNFWVKASN